jgi:cell fate regulator YaaT (PSP1 superfamily)
VVRKATANDLEKTVKLGEKQGALDYAKKMKDKYELAMKFFDVHFSFDGSRMTFAFIADGRIDFRELVKEMTRHFGRTIRLQQIGIRDEAKIMGDFGHCGQTLCCRRFLKEFNSITSEMAEIQQCSHRGSERISGACGRLMCCLFYEQPGYEELSKKMPPLGAMVNVDGKRGEVVGIHTLKQTVDVKFPGDKDEDGVIVEVDLNRKNKKKK